MGYALAIKALFSRDSQFFGGSSRGDDNGVGGNGFIVESELFNRPGQIHGKHFMGFDRKSEFFGLCGHLLNQIRAGQAFREARIIFEPVGQEDLTSGRCLFNHQRVEPGAGCIHAGGQSGRSATDNNEVVISSVHGSLLF